jgi:hypothetical protein
LKDLSSFKPLDIVSRLLEVFLKIMLVATELFYFSEDIAFKTINLNYLYDEISAIFMQFDQQEAAKELPNSDEERKDDALRKFMSEVT